MCYNNVSIPDYIKLSFLFPVAFFLWRFFSAVFYLSISAFIITSILMVVICIHPASTLILIFIFRSFSYIITEGILLVPQR